MIPLCHSAPHTNIIIHAYISGDSSFYSFCPREQTRLCLALDRTGHKLWCSDTTSALDCAGKEREGTKGDWTDQKVHFGDLRSCFSVTGLGQIAAGFCRIRNFRCIGSDLSPNQVNFIKKGKRKQMMVVWEDWGKRSIQRTLEASDWI